MSLRPNPLCSVILPVYNSADVLRHAIDSVLAQTLQDFEIIVVDDASTDRSHDVAQSYARRDPRIRVVRNAKRSRGGPVEWDSRNDGLRLATGDYVAYLDGDNTWRPEYLERLSAVLSESPGTQLVHCDSCNHYPPGIARSVVDNDLRDLVHHGPDFTVFSYETFEPARLGSGIYVDANEIMHRLSIFRALGALWNTAHPRREEVNALQWPRRPYRRHADLDLVERVVEAFGAGAVAHVEEALVDFYYDEARRPPSQARRNGAPARRNGSAASTRAVTGG